MNDVHGRVHALGGADDHRTEQKPSVAESTRRLDVGENLLREWRKAFPAKGDAAFPGHGHPAPADDELLRLRAERDLLNTAAAYFANPPT